MSWQVVHLRPLGSGGNSDVFLGTRSDTGETVVVKYLRDFGLTHARRAFAREVRILQRKLHGFITILAADVNCERPYYIMPYLDGGSLTRYAGNLNEQQLQAIAQVVAFALANLHSAFMAHGDVKPDNVLLTQDGHLKIADPLGNGIGCTVLFSQNRGGTPGYCAPEVWRGAEISCSADVYSYGATLYHLLTGSRPQNDQRLDPTAEPHHNAPKIRELIAACCVPEPAARPTMQEVLRLLRGERWIDIWAQKQQARQFVTGLCLIGVLFVAAKVLSK